MLSLYIVYTVHVYTLDLCQEQIAVILINVLFIIYIGISMPSKNDSSCKKVLLFSCNGKKVLKQCIEIQ